MRGVRYAVLLLVSLGGASLACSGSDDGPASPVVTATSVDAGGGGGEAPDAGAPGDGGVVATPFVCGEGLRQLSWACSGDFGQVRVEASVRADSVRVGLIGDRIEPGRQLIAQVDLDGDGAADVALEGAADASGMVRKSTLGPCVAPLEHVVVTSNVCDIAREGADGRNGTDNPTGENGTPGRIP